MSRRAYNNGGREGNGAHEASNMELAYGSPQGHMNMSPQASYEMSHEDSNLAYQMQKQEVKRAKKDGLDHLYKQDYQPAKFSKAVEYRNSRSYMKKLPSGHFRELDTFQDTNELKQFGLGIYFLVQFFRRLTWLFFVIMIFQCINVYINWLGSGMDSYSQSYSTYLIKATHGNYNKNKLTQYDGYIVTIIPAVSYLALLLFYFLWKGHYFGMINQVEDDNHDVRPEKFCIQIEGHEGESRFNQDQLKSFFSAFGPVFEVSLVRRFKNKLEYFEDLDQLEEEIKEEELQLVLGGGDREHLNYLKKEKAKLSKYINTLQIYPKTISAFVHFQYQKSKADCLTYFNDHYLFDTCGHNCMRGVCCCCVDNPEAKFLLDGQKLLIRNESVPTPEDIEWEHYEIGCCSKLLRIIFTCFIILVFLAISCTIIGLCSIYIGTNSGSCQGVIVPPTAAEVIATNNATILQCYCDANLIASLSDANIKTTCQNYQQDLLIAQGIQYAVILVSALTNYIFGGVVGKLVHCVRPASKSSAMLSKIVIYTAFLIFNTVFVPVLIYAEIFGTAPSNYVSLLTLISSDVQSFFKISSLSFYPDFSSTWYRNVSSVFTNYILIDIIITWVFLIIDKCIAGYDGLKDDQGKILQKHMNSKITSYKYNVYKEVSYMYLIVFMCSLFWCGVPALLPLGFISIFSRYVVTRILLQGSSSKIQGMGDDFMSFSMTFLPLTLIICPLIGEWMLVASTQIYPDQLSMTLPVLQGLSTELDKQLYLPFYLIISLTAFVIFFFYNTLVRFIACLCSLCYERKETTRPQHTRPFVQYAKGMNMLSSYNIRNNDEMRNVILNLEKYLVDKQMD